MFYYRVDLLQTIIGTGVAPFVVMSYVNRLPDDSMFRASVMGGDEWFGWGQDRVLWADIYDNISRLTEVQLTKSGVKRAKLERFPRPKREPKKPTSRLAELHAAFSGRSGVKK